MARIYNGKVSIHKNTDGEVILKADAEGAWDASNVDALAKEMHVWAKKLKVGINKYSYWVCDGGTKPVLVAAKWGKPAVWVLPEKPAAAKKTTTKLA
jgi:hypothetical protein